MTRSPKEIVPIVPLGKLRFLYLGSEKFDADIRYYRNSIGAKLIWNLEVFGARVAAFRVGDGPLYIVTDHRPARSCLPIYEVADLKETVRKLKQRGCDPERGPIEIPNGPCYLFRDPSGNELAIFQDVRPDALQVDPPE